MTDKYRVLSIKVDPKGSAVMPIGTTSERAAVPEEGEVRANTTTGRPEVYINGQWAVGVNPTDAVYKSDAATDAEIDSTSTAKKFVYLEQLWRAINKKIAESMAARKIKVSGPLEVTGGGVLGTDPTISIKDASLTERGAVQLTENVSSDSTVLAMCAKSGKIIFDKATQAYNLASSASPSSRKINTTGPIQGGGALTDDRTISIDDATTTAKGAVQLSDDTDSTSSVLAATAKAVKTVMDKANDALTAANARVHTNRQVKTTGALEGGGDLTADRTISIKDATTGQKGAVLLTEDQTGDSATLVVNQLGVKKVWTKAVEAYNLANSKWKAVDASATVKGIMQVSDSTTSTASNIAASSKAAHDLANDISQKYTAEDATTARKGIVQLSSSIASTSETQAATSKATKEAYDKGQAGLNLAGTKFTAVDASATVKGIVKLSDRVDSASQVIAANLQGVRKAYDKGHAALTAANAKWTAQDASATVKGISLLSDSVASAASHISASSKAVKTAMDKANSKWTAVDASATVKGIVRLYNGVDSTTIVQAATAGTAKKCWDRAEAAYNLAQGRAGAARNINTTSPLHGGGDLTADRTLHIQDATTGQKGAVQLNDTVTSTSTTLAATAHAAKMAYDRGSEALSKAAGQLSPSRKINTTGPINGGGTLGQDLTLSIDNASTSQKGAVQLNDGYNSTSVTMAPTARVLKQTYDLAAGKLAAGGTAKNSEKLGGQAPDKYLRTDADNNITATTAWTGDNSPVIRSGSEGGRVPAPGGGYYSSATVASVTGAIKIKLPVASKNQSDMISFQVQVYNYINDRSFTVNVHGYQHAANGWAQVTCYITGPATAVNLPVRFGADATSHCVWIGELDSVWKYPKVSVINFMAGHATDIRKYAKDWNVSIATAFGSVAETKTDNLTVSRYALDSRTVGGKTADQLKSDVRVGTVHNSDYLGNVIATDYQRTHTWTAGSVANVWKTVALVGGRGLSSHVRLSGRGTASGVVFAFYCDIIVNHSNDIIITGANGSYTTANIRVLSDGNEKYFIQIKGMTTTGTSVYLNMSTFLGEQITTYTSDHTVPTTHQKAIKEVALGLDQVTTTGAMDAKRGVRDNGQRVFSPSNRNISSSVTQDSTEVYASSRAVKIASDKANAAKTVADSKWAAVDATGSRKGILKLYDGVNSGATTTAPTSRVMKVTYDLASQALPASGTAKNSEKLGAQAPSAWLRRNTNQTITADYTFDNKGVGSVSGTGGTVMMPGGGQLITSSAKVQGAIKIKFPVATKNNSCMHTMEVAVFDYVTDKTFTVRISGYQYSSTLWTNTTAVIIGASSSADHAVRFGHDGTSHCVWIGEADYNWTYPKVSILNYMGGHSGPINEYLSGWNVSIQTTFDTVQHVRTTNLVAASAASYASKLSTKRAIALNGDASGSIQFDGSANVSIPVTVKDDSHAHSQISIPDTRGTKRPPNYYPVRNVSYDFQNKEDTDAGDDTWHCVQTIYKWETFNVSHRPEQLVYTGERIKHRVATSDTAWGAWKAFAYTSDIPGAATYTVPGIVKLSSDTSKTYSDVAATIKAVNSVKNIANSKWAMVRASTSVEGIVQLSNATDSTAGNRAATPYAVKAAMDKAKAAFNMASNPNADITTMPASGNMQLDFSGNAKTIRVVVDKAIVLNTFVYDQTVATTFFILLEINAAGGHAITIPGTSKKWYPGTGSQPLNTDANVVNIIQGIHLYGSVYYNISSYKK